MAEKRMLSKVISISEKVNTLPDLFDMLLFTWMIPHSDDFGRLTGSPAKVKALIVPMLSKSIADIDSSLARLHDNGLINWYEAEEEKVIQIESFDKHQQGLHKRTKSKFPDFPGNSGNVQEIPSELNRTEQNGTEEKGIEQEQIFGSSHESMNPFRLFENEGFGTISSMTSELLGDLIDTYSERWVCEAMKISVKKGKRNLGFVEGILKNWKTDGIDEPWGREKDDEESERRNQGTRYGKDQRESEFAFLDNQNRTGR
ncbi:DnaD domain-containing protein [Paenibacillus glucanolyticus]|uniref:DnaD domain-containing protein n=1 Tax=Paenibacillus glucanolyticus TaxID=59843 RepID=UPI00096D6BC6|nr:DnaD domain protein [Paenibacillus glucanolyticus]OMF70474.1 DNA replication protein DnaD [Paenibacillus glucanolyticus]